MAKLKDGVLTENRSGKPWTEAEVKIATAFIMGHDTKYKSLQEISERLGRSYNAVAMVQCKARWAKKFYEVL